MNLDYNEEQTMLREQIQKFCESEYDFYKREEIVKSSDDFDKNAWNLFAEQGWLSMPFSEESGGLGFGAIELSILFELINLKYCSIVLQFLYFLVNISFPNFFILFKFFKFYVFFFVNKGFFKNILCHGNVLIVI